MNSKLKTIKEPLFHISKRSKSSLKTYQVILIKASFLLAGLILSSIICSIISGYSPFDYFYYLFDGTFGTDRRIWMLFKEMFLLLGVGLALIPAFKMKFWNLGGNGQILMGCLASVMCMFLLGDKNGWSDGAVIPLMIITSILAGAIWAVIPAIFKAFFKTNESLFTLMSNYIALELVRYFLKVNSTNGSTMPSINSGHLPVIGGQQFLLTIIVVAMLTIIMILYFKFSKHGYEISVVGESENTAKYVGINVKKVTIRTIALSGAICGLIGLLLTGSLNHSITETSANNMGFTAIMAAWLAKLDPLFLLVSTFFISFINNGMGNVSTEFKMLNNSISNVVLGIIYFLLIAGEFFVEYKIMFRKKEKKSDVKTVGQEKTASADEDVQKNEMISENTNEKVTTDNSAKTEEVKQNAESVIKTNQPNTEKKEEEKND
mgnify:CR=1 FL=1